MDAAGAKRKGTYSHREPTFNIYESENLQSVGLCEKIEKLSYPKYLPRPMDINSIQALAVRLALIQYYEAKGWKKEMSVTELIKNELYRKTKTNKKPFGGFIIGDGTGVGKTRELAAFVVSVILLEKSLADFQRHVGASIFGHDNTAVFNAVKNGTWCRERSSYGSRAPSRYSTVASRACGRWSRTRTATRTRGRAPCMPIVPPSSRETARRDT